ncbi:MAG: hypothetical protein K2O18_14850 [Oscillospiraceae bacterium]|nr:hypothetical protein [Oscillospiraceae bacterium]
METNKMFEIAVRNKFRFPFKGAISVEDLWDLSVQQLDGIFKTLKSQEQKAQEESLLETRTPEDEVLKIKIEIIRHIVTVKLDEANQAERAKETRDQKQKILGILAEKQNEDLRNKTPEELRAMLEQLG